MLGIVSSPKKFYWDADLTLDWKQLRPQERGFESCSDSSKSIKTKLRLCFKDAENKFDKVVKWQGEGKHIYN